MGELRSEVSPRPYLGCTPMTTLRAEPWHCTRQRKLKRGLCRQPVRPVWPETVINPTIMVGRSLVPRGRPTSLGEPPRDQHGGRSLLASAMILLRNAHLTAAGSTNGDGPSQLSGSTLAAIRAGLGSSASASRRPSSLVT